MDIRLCSLPLLFVRKADAYMYARTYASKYEFGEDG